MKQTIQDENPLLMLSQKMSALKLKETMNLSRDTVDTNVSFTNSNLDA